MKEIQAIPDSEMDILKIIWENGGTIIFANLLDKLEACNKNWKRTTVQTFLSRMIERDIVSFRKIGRNTEYSALITEEEYLISQTEAFVKKMYRGNSKSLISALIKHDDITQEDIDEIKSFWNKGGDMHE